MSSKNFDYIFVRQTLWKYAIPCLITPPSYDSQKYIEKAGSEVETFDRGRQNHEKEVDSEMRMGNACVVTQASLQNEPGTIVLVSGDKDMRPGIK
ncbi:uncharacterized protein OCT59_004734 [Rhizophagus irregularis]|uniref:uncharacterized protein n=1 Tax=Rhizophagus irregularis TaxID=588596 RepID=UPI003332AFD4|nr:hypothetical protein OCT59_004734 [Rhizophagus irregularis]